MVATVSNSVSASTNRMAGSVITPDEEERFRLMTRNQKELLDVKHPFKHHDNHSITDEENHTDNKFIVHQHSADLLTCTNGRVSFNSELIGKAVVKCNLKISNMLDRPVAFKASCAQFRLQTTKIAEWSIDKSIILQIKSTNSRLFHIRKPRGVLQPFGNIHIAISFRGSFIPTDLTHYIGVFGVILNDQNSADDPKKIFDDHRDKEDFMRRMFISYNKTVKPCDTYLTVLRNMSAMKPVEPKSG